MNLFKLKFKELLGMLAATAVIGSIQTLSAGYVFMILLGVLHQEWTQVIAPIGYGTSIIMIALVQILFVIMRFSIDYRQAFDREHHP